MLVRKKAETPPVRTPAHKFAQARLQVEAGRALEREAIRDALEQSRWCVQPAAKVLGIPHSSLVQLLSGRHKVLAAEVEQKRVRPKPGERR